MHQWRTQLLLHLAVLMAVLTTSPQCDAWQEEALNQKRLRHAQKSFLWIEEQGGVNVVESCCDVVALPHGELGLKATKSFVEGEEMYRVPKELLLSLANMPGTAFDETGREVMEMVQRRQYQISSAAGRAPMQTHALMAAFLLMEARNGGGTESQSVRTDSFWRMYLRTMPAVCGGTNNPMLYELYVVRQRSDILNYLLQKDALFADMFRSVHEVFEDVRLFFSNTVPDMFSGEDFDFGNYSQQDIAWAVCMAFSRGFGPAGAFVPVLDLLNTASSKFGLDKNNLNTKVVYDDRGDVVLVATGNIRPGDDLLVDYKSVFSKDAKAMSKEMHLFQYGIPGPFTGIETDTVYVPIGRLEESVSKKLSDRLGKQLAASQKRAYELVTRSSPLSNSREPLLRGGGWLGFPMQDVPTLSVDDARARLLIARTSLIHLILPDMMLAENGAPRPLNKKCATGAIHLQNTCDEEPELFCHAIRLSEHAMKPLMEMCEYAEEVATRGDVTFKSCVGCSGPIADIMNGKCSMAQALLRALRRIGTSEWNCTFQ